MLFFPTFKAARIIYLGTSTVNTFRFDIMVSAIFEEVFSLPCKTTEKINFIFRGGNDEPVEIDKSDNHPFCF